MLTPAAALNWEIRRGLRLPLLWTFLATLVFPLSALTERFHAQLTGREFEIKDLQFSPPIQLTITVINLAFCLLGVGASIGLNVRQYALPVKSQLLATVRLFAGATCCTAIYLAYSTLLNLLFRTGLPTLGPALSYGVGFMVMYSALARFRGNDSRVGTAGLVVGALLLWWVCGHYGPRWWQKPTHPWPTLSASEFAILAGAAALSWWSLVDTLNRDRRGAGWGRVILPAAAPVMTSASRRPARKFFSAATALFWQEWRQDGALVPAVTVGLLIVGAVVHVTSLAAAPRLMHTPDINHDLEVITPLFGFLPLCAVIPWFLGLSGSHGKRAARKLPWPTNQSTLPISDTALGWIYLARVIASSLVAAAGVIAVCVVWYFAVELVVGFSGRRPDHAALGLNHLTVSLVCTYVANWALALWLTSGLSAAATLTGRRWIASLPLTAIVAWFAILIVGSLIPDVRESQWYWTYAGYLVLSVLLFWVVIAYVMGITYDIIRLPTLLSGFLLFVFAEVVLFTVYQMASADYSRRMPGYRLEPLSNLLIMFVALAAAPPALLPLATYWNRHR